MDRLIQHTTSPTKGAACKPIASASFEGRPLALLRACGGHVEALILKIFSS